MNNEIELKSDTVKFTNTLGSQQQQTQQHSHKYDFLHIQLYIEPILIR